MRKLIIGLMALLPAIAMAAGNDLFINQRNAADTATQTRLVAKPSTDGLFGFNVSTQLPVFFALGPNLVLSNGVLNAPLTAGPKGDTGATGPAGQDSTVPGPQGIQGAPGATGPAGAPAPTPTQSAANRSFNTIYRVSATRPAWVTYSVQLTVTATIAGGQNGDVVLEIASDASFTTAVQTVSIGGLGQVYSLAVAIQGVQPQTGVVSGFIPAGYYARLRTVSNTGTPGYLFRAGQETIL